VTVDELIEELKKQPQWAQVTNGHNFPVDGVEVANVGGTIVRVLSEQD